MIDVGAGVGAMGGNVEGAEVSPLMAVGTVGLVIVLADGGV